MSAPQFCVEFISVLFHEQPSGYAFKPLDDIGYLMLRFAVKQQVYVIFIAVELCNSEIITRGYVHQYVAQRIFKLPREDLVPILYAPHNMILNRIYITSAF